MPRRSSLLLGRVPQERRVVERQLTLLIDRSIGMAVIGPTIAQLYARIRRHGKTRDIRTGARGVLRQTGLLEKARALVRELHDDLSQSIEGRSSVLYRQFRERAAVVLQRLQA